MRLIKNELGYWEVRFKGHDGKYRSRSTGKRIKQEAIELVQTARLSDLDSAARMGVLSQEVASVLMTGDNPVSVEVALVHWREHMAYRRLSPKSISNAVIWVKCWAAWAHVERKPVTALRIDDFDGWINNQGANKLGTRNVMLAAIRSFCRFCQDSGWMAGNPANMVKVDLSLLKHAQKETLKRPCFTDEEMATLILGTGPGGEAEDLFWHASIIIARHTGLRMSDIACLEWDSIDLLGETITVWTAKRDRRVFLPIEPEIMLETVRALPHKDPVYLFPHQRNINNDVGARCSLSVQFTRIMRTLGLEPGKTFHCLRATYISDCDSRGVPIDHISRNVGHFSESITRGYIRPSE